MRCVDCGIYEALPDDELCEECLERNTADTVIYKIPWQKYDPENPPQDFEVFLIYEEYNAADEVCTAYRMNGAWFACMGTEPIFNVSYYAPINLPEGEG